MTIIILNLENSEGEQLSLSLPLSNGPRIQILNKDLNDWAVFDFKSLDDLEAAHTVLGLILANAKDTEICR